MIKASTLIDNYLNEMITNIDSSSSGQISGMLKAIKSMDEYFLLLNDYRVQINAKINSTDYYWSDLESKTLIGVVKVLSSRKTLEKLGKNVKNEINYISSPQIVGLSHANYEIHKEIRNIASIVNSEINLKKKKDREN